MSSCRAWTWRGYARVAEEAMRRLHRRALGAAESLQRLEEALKVLSEAATKLEGSFP